ncbi:MAG: LysR family transcriptional regulator [Verrucomicrobiota bacterium]|nr:LysR family transcriptional regulator [Verrucomicrobiota bacterium]
MNIHHLELFHYVAKHEGIAGAVRNIPYGIQQPAISAQVIQLENDLGTTLFQRRPFDLTPAGVELYEFIHPFFENLNSMGEKIRGGVAQTIRIGASSVVFREHLPDLLNAARKEFPGLHPALRVGIQPEIEQWLLANDVDLGVTVLGTKPPAEIKSKKLLELSMVLVVPTSVRVKSAADILGQDRIAQTLISLPQNEGISRKFQTELTARKIDWPIGMELNSTDLISTYVANGFGIGISVDLPGERKNKGVKLLPLEDFPTITIGCLWRGQLPPVGQTLVKLLQTHAAEL